MQSSGERAAITSPAGDRPRCGDARADLADGRLWGIDECLRKRAGCKASLQADRSGAQRWSRTGSGPGRLRGGSGAAVASDTDLRRKARPRGGQAGVRLCRGPGHRRRSSSQERCRLGKQSNQRSLSGGGVMSAPKARRLAGVALALICGLLAGCGGSSGSGRSLILYNGQHVQTTDSLVAAFEKQTGIGVSVRSDDEDTLADQIVTEGANSPADLLYTENSPALEYLQGRGLLAPLAASTLSHAPSRYDSPQGDWVGVSARVSVLIYNPSLISASQLPTKVSELADPKYSGKLAFAAGETDFQPIVTSYARTYGRSRGAEVAGSDQGQRRRPHLSGQRDDRRRGQPRGGRLRGGEPVLLVSHAGRDRRVERPFRRSPTSPPTIPAT